MFICNTEYPDADDVLGRILSGEEGGAYVAIGVGNSSDTSIRLFRDVREDDSCTCDLINAPLECEHGEPFRDPPRRGERTFRVSKTSEQGDRERLFGDEVFLEAKISGSMARGV